MEVKSPSYHIWSRCTLPTRCVTDDGNLDYLAEVDFVVSPLWSSSPPTPFPYCALWEEVNYVKPTFLRVKASFLPIWILSEIFQSCSGPYRMSHTPVPHPLRTSCETQPQMPHEFPKLPLGVSNALWRTTGLKLSNPSVFRVECELKAFTKESNFRIIVSWFPPYLHGFFCL